MSALHATSALLSTGPEYRHSAYFNVANERFVSGRWRMGYFHAVLSMFCLILPYAAGARKEELPG